MSDTRSKKTDNIQRPPAELIYQSQIKTLQDWDPGPVPPGWQLSPLAVEKFILGDKSLGIEKKIAAPRELISRIIVTLITNRGVMLVGEPGTAKSWLSELLTCAISGQSTLTIQGGAITNTSQLLYSWNEALLNTQGMSEKALIPGPLYRGMQQGKLVRFEEIARATPDVQDAVLSIMSERQIVVPELSGDSAIVYAREGFNIIGTSNIRDSGVKEMSAALKRRMNFETIHPIKDLHEEIAIVTAEAQKLLNQSGVTVKVDDNTVEVLVTIFHELRNGQTIDGRSTDRLVATAMSTAEAIAVLHAMGIHAYYYRNKTMHPADIIHFLIGASLKDNKEDRRRLKHYFDTEAVNKNGPHWQSVYQNRHLL